MAIEVVVPELGESVIEATVGRWLVQAGAHVEAGELLVELQTDKVDLEVSADQAGTLTQILHQEGADVEVGQVIALIEPGDGAPMAKPAAAAAAEPARRAGDASPESQPAEQTAAATPVARRLAASEGVSLAEVKGTGSQGRVTKQDVQYHLTQASPVAAAPPAAPSAVPAEPTPAMAGSDRPETRAKMSRRRRTIARRLVEAQQTAAMLTTFNEVDMSAVNALRDARKASFKERHGVSLGMSAFFVKAAVGALKAFPRLNAEIQGDEMILKHYYDIGMAIGAEEGLVVPVLRDADRLSFADIGRGIGAFARKAADGSLSLDDLRGGTFTITNGGVFGSMLSTPILNPPQVGILGLHNIVDRPVAVNGQVEIRPIMYLALSYDHRIVDGREAVQFLVRIKELIEDPELLLLEG
jgi:2-oxoglutarate dehydrogenase E2 component (dihydrolipoamide succinyltransferase)